jgi:hypothetical protein
MAVFSFPFNRASNLPLGEREKEMSRMQIKWNIIFSRLMDFTLPTFCVIRVQ